MVRNANILNENLAVYAKKLKLGKNRRARIQNKDSVGSVVEMLY